MSAQSMEEIVAFCKRRGFVFQDSEIYGGLKGTYDFGPLGIELKKNIRNAWWRAMVYERDDIEGLECSHLSHPLVWKYSGHESTFSDPLCDCKKCKSRIRADHIVDGKCPECGSTDLTEPRPFMLMMKTNIGPVDDGSSFAYLRPETAQGSYLNFKNVLDSTARKIPFGICQDGKSFRNEITPRNFLFRQREFEQAEMQYFVKPGTDIEWWNQWKEIRRQWWIEQGIPEEKLRYKLHEQLAHYAKAAVDIEYLFPWGFDEIEGIHDRQDFDLGSHTKNQSKFDISAKVMENKDSNTEMSYLDVFDNNKTFIPYVVETAMGVDRAFTVILIEAYTVENLDNGTQRIVLKLKKHLAPVKVAVIPLKRNNEQIMNMARQIKNDLLKTGIGRIMLEDSGNVGKGYRRHDEIGTPYCITVDFESIEKQPSTVTIRNRDTMEQIRMPVSELAQFFKGEFL